MCRQIKFILIPFLLFFALEVSAEEERNWKEELVYYLVVDRFHNGDPHNDGEDFNPNDPLGYQGGDIEGIIKKLDYLDSMGFTTIILSSIFEKETKDHMGEQIIDHKKIDNHFGTMGDVKQLVEEAHKRDIKILLEYTVNHVGPNHPFVNDKTKQEWFHPQTEVTNVEDEENRTTGWYKGLPDLATEQKDVREYLVETANWWMEETDIDGFYIHQADTVEAEFWEMFHQQLEMKKEIYLIGTLLDDRDRTRVSYQEAGFDSFLNNRFYSTASEAFASVDRPFQSVSDTIEEAPANTSLYIDSDHTERFTRKAIENNQHPGIRLKMAFSYMYTVPGTPIVYYGSEIAVDGGEPPNNRPLMNYQADSELIDYMSKLATIRKSLPALTKGDYNVLYEKDGLIIFTRTYKSETVVIVINNTSSSQKVLIPQEKIAENKELRGLLTGNIFEEQNGEYEFIIDRELAEVYEIKEKSGLNIPFISVFIIVPALFILFLIAAKKRGRK